MRKLLLLGGSSQQVIAINRAKEQGYYTVLCDYLPDNPGQFVADKFYQVSTTDKDAILTVAREEKIEGIVAYSSDPAAPTAAYVAEKLHLPGIPYEIAECFCNKGQFREFLKEHYFSVPNNIVVDVSEASSRITEIGYPAIVKPMDSSGSKGVTVVRNTDEIGDAVKFAAEYSKCQRLVIEEFIERDHKDVIEAEIFVINGKVAVWGLMNAIRDSHTNPLLPAAYSYPLNISDSRIELVKSEISRLMECAEIKYGGFNIEMVIDKNEHLYFLDVGPRNGGNMLPEYISMISKHDIVKATVCAAMGDYDRLDGIELNGLDGGYWGLVVFHTDGDGAYAGMKYSDMAQKCLVREHFFVNTGDEVHPFRMARDAVGLGFFEFPDRNIMEQIMENKCIHDHEHHINVVVQHKMGGGIT